MTAFVTACPRLYKSLKPSFTATSRPLVCSPLRPAAASLEGPTQNSSDSSDSSDSLHSEDAISTQPSPTPSGDSHFVSIIEHCPGPPWKFKGRRVYMVDMRASECDVIEDEAWFLKSFRFPDTFFNILFPEGWPDSVGPGYAQWVKWHTCRHIFRNAYYVLGTTSLLYSLGLDTGQALAVGASVKWVLKDGLGMSTKLLVSTRLASIVDSDPKRWRFIGDSFMALSACVEILSVAKPVYFLVFGAVAALLKEAGGAMSGPAYRVFLDSFAVNSNIGDVSSRGEAQVVIGNVIGLGLGVAIKTLLDSQQSVDRLLPTLAFFAVLAASHLASTFQAVSSVNLRILNWQRLNLIIDEYLSNGYIPSIETVNKQEKFIYAWSPPPDKKKFRVGAPLLDFVECGRDISAALKNSKDRFVVAYNKSSVGVMLREDARPEDMVRAVLQGRHLLHAVDKSGGAEGWSRVRIGEKIAESYSWTQERIPDFLEGLDASGWSMAKVLVDTEGCRFKRSKT